MNEQLEKSLAELLQKSINGIDASSVFLTGQLPDAIHQLLQWKLWQSIISIGIGILLLLACIFFTRMTKKNHREEMNKEWVDREEPRFLLPGLGALSTGIMCAALLINSTYSVAKIIIAPKIYLIEYAADLAKTKH